MPVIVMIFCQGKDFGMSTVNFEEERFTMFAFLVNNDHYINPEVMVMKIVCTINFDKHVFPNDPVQFEGICSKCSSQLYSNA